MSLYRRDDPIDFVPFYVWIVEFVSYCNRCHADRAKDDPHPKRCTRAGSISDETVTLSFIWGAWGFLGGVCGGEDSPLQPLHRWNLLIPDCVFR